MGLMQFGFDCFPQALDRARGHAEGLPEILEKIVHVITSKNGLMSSQMMAGCFRGYAKSTWLGNIVPLWCIGYALKRFIVLMNDNLSKAMNVSMYRLKLNMSSQNYKFVFGDMNPEENVEFDGKQWNKQIIVCNNRDFNGEATRTMVMACGINQSIRSMVGGNSRPDLLICDDIESEKNTRTETIRDYNYDVFFNQDIPAMDMQNGAVCSMATPVHGGGLYFKLKDNKNIHVIEKPLYKKDADGYFVKDNDGNYIPEWPAFYPISRCREIEEYYRSNNSKGVVGFNQEFLLILTSDETRVIPSTLIQYADYELQRMYNRNWIKFKSINGNRYLQTEDAEWQPIHIAICGDPATTLQGKSCNTAVCVLGTLHDGRKIVMDYSAGKYNDEDILYPQYSLPSPYAIETNLSRIQTKGIIGEMFRLALLYRPDVMGVESVNAFVYIPRKMNEIYERWFTMTNHDVRFSIEEIIPPGDRDKDDRILSWIRPEYSRMRMYHHGEVKMERSASGVDREVFPMRQLYDELTNFGSWVSKDIVDAMAMCVEKSRPPQKISLLEYKKKLIMKERKKRYNSPVNGVEEEVNTGFIT